MSVYLAFTTVVLLALACWSLHRIMRVYVEQSIWLRRRQIEGSMMTYFATEMRFPQAAAMIHAGEFKYAKETNGSKLETDNLANLFSMLKFQPLPPADEAANEALRTLAQFEIRLINQIFIAADVGQKIYLDASARDELRELSKQAISQITARSWKFYQNRRSYYDMLDFRLSEYIDEVVEHQVGLFETDVAEAAEVCNA